MSGATPDEPTVSRAASLWGAGAGVGLAAMIGVCGLPALLERRRDHNETAAIGALKTIATAQSLFREADKEGDGNLDYGTLAELGAAGLIDRALVSGTQDGYLFQAGYGLYTSEFLWFAVAEPIRPGWDGDRYFCVNQEGATFYTTRCPFRFNVTDCTVPSPYPWWRERR